MGSHAFVSRGGMFVPKQPAANGEQLSPEFIKWLRTKNVRTREIKRQPELVKRYQKEWLRETTPKRAGRKLLPFSLPNFNMLDILNHVNKAQQVLSVIQNLQTVLPSMGTKEITKNDEQ